MNSSLSMMDHKKGRRDDSLVFSKARNTDFENPNNRGDNSFAWVVIWSVERLENYILSSYEQSKAIIAHMGGRNNLSWLIAPSKSRIMMASRESRSAFCETPTIEIQEVSYFCFFTATAPWCIQHILHTFMLLLWAVWAVEEWDEWIMDHGSRFSEFCLLFQLGFRSLLFSSDQFSLLSRTLRTHVSYCTYRTEARSLKTHEFPLRPGHTEERRKRATVVGRLRTT